MHRFITALKSALIDEKTADVQDNVQENVQEKSRKDLILNIMQKKNFKI